MQKPRILVLDDEQILAECIAGILAVHMPSADIQFTSSNPEAMNWLKTSHYDVVISDGAAYSAAFVREFNQIAGTTSLIFMSGSTVVLQEARSYGAVHTLSKPFPVPVLLDKLRQLGFSEFIRELPGVTS